MAYECAPFEHFPLLTHTYTQRHSHSRHVISASVPWYRGCQSRKKYSTSGNASHIMQMSYSTSAICLAGVIPVSFRFFFFSWGFVFVVVVAVADFLFSHPAQSAPSSTFITCFSQVFQFLSLLFSKWGEKVHITHLYVRMREHLGCWLHT